jgi:hypothetical protein
LEPIKILIFVGAFLLLLLVGRLLSAASEVHAQELPHDGAPLLPVQAVKNSPSPQSDVLTGAEVGFPFTLPPVTEDDKGRFNRPYYTNYYFGKTDLVRGPADPRSFVDDLFLVAQDPGSEQVWETKYVVATPSGLQQMMSQEQYASLYLDDTVVIVSEWNLPVILRTVVDEDLKRFGAAGEEQPSPPAINNLIG